MRSVAVVYQSPSDQIVQLTSSSLILLSSAAIFSAFSSFASPSFLPSSFSVEYVRLAASTLEATDDPGLTCLLTMFLIGCSVDNERDIVVCIGCS